MVEVEVDVENDENLVWIYFNINESDSVESVDKEGSIVEVEVEVDELDIVDVGVVIVDDEGVVDVILAGRVDDGVFDVKFAGKVDD